MNHPRDNPKGRQEVAPFYSDEYIPCQAESAIALSGNLELGLLLLGGQRITATSVNQRLDPNLPLDDRF